MVKITEDKLIIEISHVCPRDIWENLQEAIVFALQNQYRDTLETEKLHDAYFFLLLLLQATLVEESELKKGSK